MNPTVMQNYGSNTNKMSKNNSNTIGANQNCSNSNIEADIDSIDNIDDTQKNALLLKIFKSVKATTDHDAIFRLFSSGASSNAMDPDGKTLLMIAAEKGYVDLIGLLLEQKAEIKQKDKNGKNALFYGLESPAENVDSISLLLDKGADVNSETVDKMTPLIKAVEKGFSDIAKILIQKGANVHAALEGSGDTSLHIAVRNKNKNLIRLLLENNCDPLRKNKKRYNAFDLAQNDQDLFNFLTQLHFKQKTNQSLAIQNAIEKSSNSNYHMKDNKDNNNHSLNETIMNHLDLASNNNKGGGSTGSSNNNSGAMIIDSENLQQQSYENTGNNKNYQRKNHNNNKTYSIIANTLNDHHQSQHHYHHSHHSNHNNHSSNSTKKSSPETNSDYEDIEKNNYKYKKDYNKSIKAKEYSQSYGMPQHNQQINNNINNLQYNKNSINTNNNNNNNNPNRSTNNINYHPNPNPNPGINSNNISNSLGGVGSGPAGINPNNNFNKKNGKQQQQQQQINSINKMSYSQKIPYQNQQQQQQTSSNTNIPVFINKNFTKQQQQSSSSKIYLEEEIIPTNNSLIINGQILKQSHNPTSSSSNNNTSMTITTSAINNNSNQSSAPYQGNHIYMKNKYNYQQHYDDNNNIEEINKQATIINYTKYNDYTTNNTGNMGSLAHNLETSNNNNTNLMPMNIINMNQQQQAHSPPLQPNVNLSIQQQQQGNIGPNPIENIHILKNIVVNIGEATQRETISQIADAETFRKKALELWKTCEDLKKENEKIKNENRDAKLHIDKIQKNENKLKDLIKEKDKMIEVIKKEREDLEDPNRLAQLQKNHLKDTTNKIDKCIMTDQIFMSLKSGGENSIREFKPFQKNIDTLYTEDVANILNEEVISFEQWIAQYNLEKKTLFDSLTLQIKQAVNEAMPNSECFIYGSFATGLSLPWSDIDVVIRLPQYTSNNYTNQQYLEAIEGIIRKKKWSEEARTIKNTSVPVLKITCSKEYLNKKVDISIQDARHNGLRCVELVKEYLQLYPQLKPLVLALKYFLYILNFNDTYQGGLSSYGLILMIVYLLQRPGQRTSNGDQNNLGLLLLNFLYRYGIEYDYMSTFQVLPQKPQQHEMANNFPLMFNFNMPSIYIQDPLNPQNNVGRSTFNILKIKTAFMAGYLAAHQYCHCGVHKSFNDLVITEGEEQGQITRGIKTKECSSVFKKILTAYLSFENCSQKIYNETSMY